MKLKNLKSISSAKSADHNMKALQRSFQISLTSLKYLVIYRLTRYRRMTLGTRLRLACEELGFVFIKIGQILSTRYELLSREDCVELQKLLDNVPPIPYEQVKEIFKKDFGIMPENLFRNWNPAPLASASVAQVYKAHIPKYGDVAIKVRRPGIEKNIRADLAILKCLGKIAQMFSRDLRQINLTEVFKQIESWLLTEINFRNEADNLDRISNQYYGKMREVIGKYANSMVFAKVYRDFSSDQVITMEFIEGIPVRNFRSIENNPLYDIPNSIKSSMGAIMRMWIRGDEFAFHGDPHPSNLLILPHGKLAFLDFGLLGYLSKKDTKETRDLLLAVYAQDLEATIRTSLKMLNASYKKYSSMIREDIKKYLETAKDSAMGYWFTGIARVFIKHKIPFAYHIILIGRMQAIVEGLFETVMPGTTTIDAFGDELKRGLRQQIFNNLLETDLNPIFYALSEQTKKSPRLIAELIDTYFNDPAQAIRDFKEIITA